MAVKVYWRVPFKGRQIGRLGWITISLGMEAFAINVWSYAKRIVPVDTGSLRGSIRIMKYGSISNPWTRYQILAGGGNIGDSGFRNIGRGGGGVGVGSVTDITKGMKWRNPYYALYIELGTVRMRAQPFMRPAFNKHKYKLKALVRKVGRQKFTRLRRG